MLRDSAKTLAQSEARLKFHLEHNGSMVLLQLPEVTKVSLGGCTSKKISLESPISKTRN